MKHPNVLAFQPSTADPSGSGYCACALGTAFSGTYCPILFFDIASFGAPERDNDIHLAVRRGLYQILHSTFGRFDIPPAAYYREDCGDGVLSVFPPTIAADTITCLPLWLPVEIQRYNKCASPAARIQLRAALHIGPVYWDEHGVYGQAVIHAARLIDAQPVKDALAATHADLVFVVSESVYDAVVQHIPQPAGVQYRKIRTRVKESSITAWITLSDPDPGRFLTAVPDTP
jgi:class 3 adenylate cyclase